MAIAPTGSHICHLQRFGADLALVDVVLAGGTALADKLGIPKAILYITGNLPPVVGHAYGSGVPLLSTVPQWQTALPRNMVTCCTQQCCHKTLLLKLCHAVRRKLSYALLYWKGCELCALTDLPFCRTCYA